MSSGTNPVVTGSIVGTGADLQVRGLPSRPKHITFVNADGDVGWWNDAMTNDRIMVTVDTTGVTTERTTNGVTPQAGGFDLGADADLNQSGVVIYYTAHCE